MDFWTYKTLRFGKDGAAIWHTMPFKFPFVSGAAMAAQAYMLAHAERGEMVVVSLEPCEELKPTMDRLVEHDIMLNELKRTFADRNGYGGLQHHWDMIHAIDPNWPNPWRDPDDPDGLCICAPHKAALNCPIHGDPPKCGRFDCVSEAECRREQKCLNGGPEIPELV